MQARHRERKSTSSESALEATRDARNGDGLESSVKRTDACVAQFGGLVQRQEYQLATTLKMLREMLDEETYVRLDRIGGDDGRKRWSKRPEREHAPSVRKLAGPCVR